MQICWSEYFSSLVQSVLSRRRAYELLTWHPRRRRVCGSTSSYSAVIGSYVASHGGKNLTFCGVLSMCLPFSLGGNWRLHLQDKLSLPPQDYEVHECLKQLLMSLLRAYRFSPIVPDLSLQVSILLWHTSATTRAKGEKLLCLNGYRFTDIVKNLKYPVLTTFGYRDLQLILTEFFFSCLSRYTTSVSLLLSWSMRNPGSTCFKMSCILLVLMFSSSTKSLIIIWVFI